jgi:hypothetical protein
MSRLDFAVDREMQLGDRRIPDRMITLTRTHQVSASLTEQAQKFRRKTADHQAIAAALVMDSLRARTS